MEHLNKVYKFMAFKQTARLSCIKDIDNSTNEENIKNWEYWLGKHTSELENILQVNGFNHSNYSDNFDFEKSSGDKLIFNGSWHLMNETGYFIRYINFVVTITASLMFDFKIDIKGKFGIHQEIKDIISQNYEVFLSSGINETEKGD